MAVMFGMSNFKIRRDVSEADLETSAAHPSPSGVDHGQIDGNAISQGESLAARASHALDCIFLSVWSAPAGLVQSCLAIDLKTVLVLVSVSNLPALVFIVIMDLHCLIPYLCCSCGPEKAYIDKLVQHHHQA